ncbi:aldose 1-epimerase [Novosphingobium resinovorum]|uniref:aldose 1-epimerase n=1 Tax=Novosphingobium resinovorum TaxID=158500 RepID=UPI002ED40E25|nr:aldose 1-epimerase [Novosphingobium resinovorum]
MIRLRSGSSEATLLPRIGGAIGSFSVDGRAILRPTPEGTTDPLETACFPLVPYANRIADGRFTFAGRGHALPCNVHGFAHPLHGLGWLKAWTIEDQAEDRAVVACSHEADAHWPWDWSATQRCVLEDGALHVLLEVTNRAAAPMPCGLGQHPYFVRDPDGRLRFAAAGVWLNDDGMIPARRAPADHFGNFAQGAVPLAGSLTDNCWFGWDGTATWQGAALQSDEARFVHVFAPPEEAFLCIEPTSQMPDAFNRTDDAGGTVLEPGGSARLGMTIRASGPARPVGPDGNL